MRIRVLIGVHLDGWMMVQSVVFGFCPVSLQQQPLSSAHLFVSKKKDEKQRRVSDIRRKINQSINQVGTEGRISKDFSDGEK